MKKLIILFCIALSPFYLKAQVGINTTNPQSELDVNGTIRSQNLTGGLMESLADGTIVDKTSNQELYTPIALGANNALNVNLPADTFVYTTSNGNYSGRVTLPNAASSLAAHRIGSVIVIKKESQFVVRVQTPNTDLNATLILGTNSPNNIQTASFVFDGTQWVFLGLAY